MKRSPMNIYVQIEPLLDRRLLALRPAPMRRLLLVFAKDNQPFCQLWLPYALAMPLPASEGLMVADI